MGSSQKRSYFLKKLLVNFRLTTTISLLRIDCKSKSEIYKQIFIKILLFWLEPIIFNIKKKKICSFIEIIAIFRSAGFNGMLSLIDFFWNNVYFFLPERRFFLHLMVTCQLGSLNKKEIQMNFRKIFSVLIFNELYLFS